MCNSAQFLQVGQSVCFTEPAGAPDTLKVRPSSSPGRDTNLTHGLPLPRPQHQLQVVGEFCCVNQIGDHGIFTEPQPRFVTVKRLGGKLFNLRVASQDLIDTFLTCTKSFSACVTVSGSLLWKLLSAAVFVVLLPHCST